MLTMAGTFSKHPRAWGFENDLTVISANGATVKLSDGREYIDWVSALGTNLFGYGHFDKVLAAHLADGGGSLSLPHQLEYKAADMLAKLLSENIPYWNDENLGVRFALSGTDAVSMAVRLARAATGRDGVLCVKGSYHGWADWTVARTPPAAGVPYELVTTVRDFEFNDLESLSEEDVGLSDYGYQPAAVVIEQGLTPPDPGFYDSVRKYCDDNGTILIMDEVVTGLRYGLGGVCGLRNIKPDLVCMGKALGNGMPVSALVGPTELMNEFAKLSPVFCSSTHWGNSLNMAAVIAVLEAWDSQWVNYLWYIGMTLIAGLRNAGWSVIGEQPRNLVTFSSIEEQAFFIHGMREEGILMNRPNFPTLSHTADMVEQTIAAARRVRAKYKTALERGTLVSQVEGKLPKVLFSDR